MEKSFIEFFLILLKGSLHIVLIEFKMRPLSTIKLGLVREYIRSIREENIRPSVRGLKEKDPRSVGS